MSHGITLRASLLARPLLLESRRFAFTFKQQKWTSMALRSQPEKQESAETSEAKASTSEPTESDEPIWVRREKERELMKAEGSDLPFAVYLLSSAIVAIAAVGSVFEYVNKNPIFDVIEADSPFYAPILAIFAFTGLPTSGYLFYRAVQAANKEAERMDKLDGY